MKRRSFLTAAACALLSVSGCVAEPGTNGGLLEALETQKPAGATVTPANDERVRSVEPIQTALDRASADDGVADLRLNQSEFDTTADTLTPLPWYERPNGSISGIYLRHESEIFVASLWPYCSDSLIGSAESERGVYGRGGCLDPEERPGNP